jgi:hypothetical protein
MQMLLDLMEERQKWLNKRDEAIREITRLTELIRATRNMVPPEQLARYEPTFERIEQRPVGLSLAIRSCFTAAAAGIPGVMGLEQAYTGKEQGREGAGKAGREAEASIVRGRAGESKLEAGTTGSEKTAWLTPVEIRDALKRMGFPFDNYKANPLASIHTTLKRMVPAEIEVKTRADGQKAYRLKSAGEWAQAFAEVRQWLRGSFDVVQSAGSVVAVRKKDKEQKQDAATENTPAPAEGAKRGTSGGA